MKRNISAVLDTTRASLLQAILQTEPEEEEHVQSCLAKLEEEGVRYSAEDRDRRIIIRVHGLPRVEYFPAKNRWRVAGDSKRHHGTVEQLVSWIKESVR